MNISQPTFHRLVLSARKKIADADNDGVCDNAANCPMHNSNGGCHGSEGCPIRNKAGGCHALTTPSE